jgi:hypothetical protein
MLDAQLFKWQKGETQKAMFSGKSLTKLPQKGKS